MTSRTLSTWSYASLFQSRIPIGTTQQGFRICFASRWSGQGITKPQSDCSDVGDGVDPAQHRIRQKAMAAQSCEDQHVDRSEETESDGDTEQHAAGRNSQVAVEEKQEENQSTLHQSNATIRQLHHVVHDSAVGVVRRIDRPHHRNQQSHQGRPAKQNDTQVSQVLIRTERILEYFLETANESTTLKPRLT